MFNIFSKHKASESKKKVEHIDLNRVLMQSEVYTRLPLSCVIRLVSAYTETKQSFLFKFIILI